MGAWRLQLHAEQDLSRGLGRTRRKPAPYHGRRPMGSQPGGWRERRNAADQLGGIRAWSPRVKVAGNLVGYDLPLRLRAACPLGGVHGWPFRIPMMYWAAATAAMANARENASCLRAVMPRTVARRGRRDR